MFSWFIVSLYYCTMYVLGILGKVLIGNRLKHTVPCLDCLCSSYINPVQRTEVMLQNKILN